MKFILGLKHWQLFLLLLFLSLLQGRFDKAGVFVNLLILLILIGWLWALGTHGQKTLVANNIARKSTGLFAFNIAYLCAFFILLAGFQLQHNQQYYFPRAEKPLWWLAWGYCIFAAVQATWFTARTLSMIENAGEYFWGTTVVYFFFLLFPVLGIWVIQPLANKWVQKTCGVQY